MSTTEFVMNDIDGNPLHEGDRVMAFAARYEVAHVEDKKTEDAFQMLLDNYKP